MLDKVMAHAETQDAGSIDNECVAPLERFCIDHPEVPM